MPPPNLPKRPPSSTTLPAVDVVEEWAPGAVHELRPITASTDTATTVRPPPPMPREPPKEYQRPRSSVAMPRLTPPPLPPSESIEKTMAGPLPKLDVPPPRPKLDSVEVATETLLAELAEASNEKRAAEAEAEQLRQQLRALEHSNHLPRVDVAPVSSPPPKRSDWVKAAFGLLGAITLFLGGLGTYLGARAATKENKVDNVAAKQAQQQAVTDPLPEKVSATDRYNRLMAAALSCRLRHIRGALERDGMSLEALPSGAVDWRSRYLPGRSLRAAPEWVASDDCPEMPAPP